MWPDARDMVLGLGGAGTSPRGQGGREQGVEGLASGRASLMLHLHQVGHVICKAAAGHSRTWTASTSSPRKLCEEASHVPRES